MIVVTHVAASSTASYAGLTRVSIHLYRRHPEVLAASCGEPRRIDHERLGPSFETPRKRAAPQSRAGTSCSGQELRSFVRHARPWAGHPRLLQQQSKKDVDGRDEA